MFIKVESFQPFPTLMRVGILHQNWKTPGWKWLFKISGSHSDTYLEILFIDERIEAEWPKYLHGWAATRIKKINARDTFSFKKNYSLILFYFFLKCTTAFASLNRALKLFLLTAKDSKHLASSHWKRGKSIQFDINHQYWASSHVYNDEHQICQNLSVVRYCLGTTERARTGFILISWIFEESNKQLL